MKITLKLFASLASYLPPADRRAGKIQVEAPPGSTVADLIARHGLPPALCTLVLVNGQFVAQGEQGRQVLGEGDVLAIWPPVGGG
jgi:sulfur carrier protein ThiS